jgi:peptidoglycan-associated lipoprotein
VNLGADANKLTIISYGKEKLLDTAETEGADSKNRRANFVVRK